MRVATGPGRVREKPPGINPGLYALLYNFDIDDSSVKAEHQTWLLDKAVTVLTRARKHKIGIKGMASRSGSNSYNLNLSLRRVQAVETFLKSQGVQPDQIDLNWVGENEAAAFGAKDGTENEEDRAVAVYLNGPPSDLPKIARVEFWNDREGLDLRAKRPWKMVPANDTTGVRILNAAGWKLTSSDFNRCHVIHDRTQQPVFEFIVPTNDFVLELEGWQPGDATILAEDIFGRKLSLLDVSVLVHKICQVACHFVTDSAGNVTTRKPSDESPMITVANDVFLPQANIEFQVVHSKSMTAKENWGNPITYKEMGGEFLPLLAKYMVKSARINCFFVWDYNPGKGDTDAEVDNIGGKGVIFEDDAGTDVGLSMAHEFGHNLGLAHDESRKELVMYPFTDQRGGVLDKAQILKVHAKV